MDPVSFGSDNGEQTYQDGGPVGDTPVGEDLSLSSPFLNEVAPDHRSIVAPYIKKWDAGVTKKFQEYSGKLRPYEQLGVPVEELQKYVNLANNFTRDPENVFRVMWNMFQQQYPDDFDKQLARILQFEEEAMSEDFQGGYEEEVDPSEVFQQNVMSELEDLRNWRQQQEESRQYAEESQQLDTVLTMMHNKYGNFDDNWILTRLAEHGNVDQAVKEWNAMLGKYSQNGSQRQAPKVMGGQGGVPSGQIDTKALRGKDRRQIVAQLLEAAGD